VLGSGTFGQVVRCRARDSGRQAAVKVIKNHPAYFHQAHVEIGILHMLNTKCDERDEHHIVRMLDHFVHKSHLCIVFEVLNVNLYELLRQNNFRGLNAKLVRKFAEQLLRSLRVLRSANVIHCDLKPENILVKSLDTGEIKLIDFGSACFENRTVYQYIQSRFYRSPEVVLGAPYGMPIDMWSLGCVIAELFLGLPLFPGASEYNLMTRICETLGPPPASMLDKASNAKKFFRRETGGAETGGISAAMQPGGGVSSYRLKTLDEYEQDSKKRAAVGKKYFKHTLLRDIIAHGGGSSSSKTKDAGTASADATKQDRAALLDLLEGCLRADPTERWTPDQAAAHPFITEAPFVGAFTPPPPEEAGVAGEERVRREQSAARAAAKVARQGQAAAATADARPRDAMEPATPSSSLGKAPATPESVAAKPAAAGAPGGGLAAALAATSPASAADAQRALLLQQQQMFQQQQQLFQQQQQQQQQMAAGFSPGSFGGTPGSYGGSFGSSGFAPGALPFGMSPHALNSAALHPLHFGQSPPTSQLSAIGLAAGMQQAAAAAAAAAVQLPTLQPGVAESPGGPGFFPLRRRLRADRRCDPPLGGRRFRVRGLRAAAAACVWGGAGCASRGRARGGAGHEPEAESHSVVVVRRRRVPRAGVGAAIRVRARERGRGRGPLFSRDRRRRARGGRRGDGCRRRRRGLELRGAAHRVGGVPPELGDGQSQTVAGLVQRPGGLGPQLLGRAFVRRPRRRRRRQRARRADGGGASRAGEAGGGVRRRRTRGGRGRRLRGLPQRDELERAAVAIGGHDRSHAPAVWVRAACAAGRGDGGEL
jgi:dual specificity protein kinase YAK1